MDISKCKYAHIDPFDDGLRCCNRKSEWCTEWCPDDGCEQFESDVTSDERLIAKLLGE